MITVTKTFLPPQEEYQAKLKLAWDSGWITNRGTLVNELEASLKTYLDVKHILITTNGTVPIQIAIKALGLEGEIITTPFSYVATSSCIVWEGCTPVFVDIDKDSFTIDDTKIEAAITEDTSAILATHVYGNPCNVEAIDAIAKKHNLKVIYDAAHCFGVKYKGQSIFNYGDVSTCSFHATKVFHTGEGGALFTKNSRLMDQLFYHHNFGYQTENVIKSIGINAKISEPQAAIGLTVLPYMEDIFNRRKAIVERYDIAFKDERLKTLNIRDDTHWNFSYYPLVFNTEEEMLKVKNKLNSKQIFPRRYFYPSLNTLDYVEYCSCPISESLASRILCLPLYPQLEIRDQQYVIKLIMETI